MGRVVKVVLVLLILGFAGLAGFAYFGNLEPDTVRIEAPVILDGK